MDGCSCDRGRPRPPLRAAEVRSAGQDAAGNVVAVAREASVPVAILRRVWSQVPYLGDAPFMLPFHFDITTPNGQQLGTYRRLWSLRDRYLLDLTADSQRVLDRRVALGLTVALDALQDR